MEEGDLKPPHIIEIMYCFKCPECNTVHEIDYELGDYVCSECGAYVEVIAKALKEKTQ